MRHGDVVSTLFTSHLPRFKLALLSGLLLSAVACEAPVDEGSSVEARTFELDGDEWSRVDAADPDSLSFRSSSQEACTCTIGDGHTQTEGIYDSVAAAQSACSSDASGCGDSTATLECTTVNQAPQGRAKEM